jgi:hypothetical protein
VVGGVVGGVACFAAIFLWFRQLWRTVASHDRTFLLALLPALAAYAAIDNVLIYTTGLALFAYLGVLLTRAGPGSGEPGVRRRHSGKRRSRHEHEARQPVDA